MPNDEIFPPPTPLSRIEKGADDLGDTGFDKYFGLGRKAVY